MCVSVRVWGQNVGGNEWNTKKEWYELQNKKHKRWSKTECYEKKWKQQGKRNQQKF